MEVNHCECSTREEFVLHISDDSNFQTHVYIFTNQMDLDLTTTFIQDVLFPRDTTFLIIIGKINDGEIKMIFQWQEDL